MRRLLPKAAQDGSARRRARGAVLPVVPLPVPKDHGVARGAGAGRRVAGGRALGVRANPGPAAMRGLYDMNSALMTGVVGEPRFAAVEAQCYQALP